MWHLTKIFKKSVQRVPDNSPQKIKFRGHLLELQNWLSKSIDDGILTSVMDQATLKHYFSPIDEKYGCCTYARQIFLPKGSLAIGKIHRYQHLNFILQGKVRVSTEFGVKHFQAPCIFISEVGLKRAVYAEEDTIWTTVHMTQYQGEENLDKIEDEVIAKNYEDIGLISSFDTMTAKGAIE